MERHLVWDACFNARDVGGLSTRDGRTIRWRALVRTDNLARLTPAGREALVGYGVRSVVDLRLPFELGIDPNPFASPSEGAPLYANVPLQSDDPELNAAANAVDTLAEVYRLIVDGCQMHVGAAAAAVARAPEGGVVVHCHAGKDRTGILVALLLDLVGVDEETIAADYALSGANLEALNREWLDRNAKTPEERERLHRKGIPAPEVILDTLAHVRRGHGSSEAYLRGGGLTDEDLDALRRRLLA